MAEQHSNLLKVIELQNSSIQALNKRINALAASQLVVAALLLDSEQSERQRLVQHLSLLLENQQISENPYLAAQLKELLEICRNDSAEDVLVTPENSADDAPKAHPSWFKGIIQGGLNFSKIPDPPKPEDTPPSSPSPQEFRRD